MRRQRTHFNSKSLLLVLVVIGCAGSSRMGGDGPGDNGSSNDDSEIGGSVAEGSAGTTANDAGTAGNAASGSSGSAAEGGSAGSTAGSGGENYVCPVSVDVSGGCPETRPTETTCAGGLVCEFSDDLCTPDERLFLYCGEGKMWTLQGCERVAQQQADSGTWPEILVSWFSEASGTCGSMGFLELYPETGQLGEWHCTTAVTVPRLKPEHRPSSRSTGRSARPRPPKRRPIARENFTLPKRVPIWLFRRVVVSSA